ncbi:hypothetical protein MKY95_09960 [Paenibacillus sp. FSL P4-0176]|uniref:hypothetical protein n=1 Tax=Paenibacillus sp. FSL P4-0176 TaxID=2921631 RepID=UPI0030D3B73D
MLPEDSLFEQIMKLNRTSIPNRKKLKIKPQSQQKVIVSFRDSGDLDIRYKSLITETKDRSIPMERLLEIRKELSEIRRLKRVNKKL